MTYALSTEVLELFRGDTQRNQRIMKQYISLGIILCLLTSCSNHLDKKYSTWDFEDDIQKIRESESTDSAGIALLEWIPMGLLSGEIRKTMLEGKTYREIIYDVKKYQEERANIPEHIPVKDYHKAWLENELKSESLYKGKQVALSGIIFSIGRRAITNIPYVDLDINFFDGFTCEFSEEDIEKLANLKKGQKIIIVGTGENGWTLKNCYIP